MEIMILGGLVAFNFLIIYAKIRYKRYLDGSLDFFVLAVLSILFGGSYAGLVVATVASAVVSLFLLAFPPRLKLPKLP